MRVAIHQPQYISYIGYFNKILRSDLFVYFDDCQYQDDGFQNRNKVFYSGKFRWLTIPISGSKHLDINKTKIANISDWQKSHRSILIASYGNTKYFNSIFEEIEFMYKSRWDKLSDFSIAYDDIICKILSINTRRISSSSLKLPRNLKASDKLVAICKKVGADRYLSGQGGKNYMEISKFSKNKINIDYQKHSGKYLQHDSNPSILDFLFNKGSRVTKKIVSVMYKSR